MSYTQIPITPEQLRTIQEALVSPETFEARKLYPCSAGDLSKPIYSNGGVDVFGVDTMLTPGDKQHSCIIVYCKNAKKAYVLFYGNCFSNFNGPIKGPFAPMCVYGKNGKILKIPMPCSEFGFQLAKAAMGGDACIESLKKVMEAKKPAQTKAATSYKNMQCPDGWDSLSGDVMKHVITLKLADPGFYELMKSIVDFCFNHLGAESSTVIENTDDATWGNGMTLDDKDKELFSTKASKHIAACVAAGNEVTWAGKNRITDVFAFIIHLVKTKTFEEVQAHIKSMPPLFKLEAVTKTEAEVETKTEDEVETKPEAEVETDADVATKTKTEVVPVAEAKTKKQRLSDFPTEDLK